MRRVALLLAVPLLAATPLFAAVAQDAAPSSLDSSAAPLTIADADTLKPGSYLWHPEVAAAGPIGMVVDLQRQVAFVYRGDALIGITTVSTGREGHETPLGTFPILQKQVEHKSNLYNAAPMPYMQRLTWDGVALHAGGVPGYRESHGCVHMPVAFAKALYGQTDLGAVVAITEDGTTMADALPATPQDAPADPSAPILDDQATPTTVASAAP
ncbi:L,D-transpeptidase family protein [Sphingomonas abietis]|uniref:L,D-transpeptidase family protein n=1 Tax=Sphingomonas abietis TaxID=3012344 RepID=A0ABY7NJC3_9SPHN|nr:L,D-transpeptidase family protein [Sphingomonas abietis]WBO21593.1 L,D-transpeptidase family protein [Sphingomonas abietis]